MASDQDTDDAYHELCCYTLAHGDPSFIHQHIVDAFAAQQADAGSRPIGVTMALVGLYLYVEKQFSGRQVQRAHMRLAQQKRIWPAFTLPAERGSITAVEVMAAPAGCERDRAIHMWCISVWEAFADNRHVVADFLQQHGII
jgi:uncharacterized protein DUF5946